MDITKSLEKYRFTDSLKEYARLQQKASLSLNDVRLFTNCFAKEAERELGVNYYLICNDLFKLNALGYYNKELGEIIVHDLKSFFEDLASEDTMQTKLVFNLVKKDMSLDQAELVFVRTSVLFYLICSLQNTMKFVFQKEDRCPNVNCNKIRRKDGLIHNIMKLTREDFQIAHTASQYIKLRNAIGHKCFKITDQGLFFTGDHEHLGSYTLSTLNKKIEEVANFRDTIGAFFLLYEGIIELKKKTSISCEDKKF